MAFPDLDALLTRPQTAEALNAAGFPITPDTLKTLASRGGGPAYGRFGRATLYRWGDSLNWARSKLAASMRCNTSEADRL